MTPREPTDVQITNFAAQPAVSKHSYLVVFRTDEGKRKRLRLDLKEEFDRYEEGRRYTKKAGQDLPDAAA